MDVSLLFQPVCADMPAPEYQTEGASGFDLRADFEGEPIVVQPGFRHIFPTGVFLAVPLGYEVQIRSRSGLSAKNGVMVLNSPGTIDADYRGQIMIILANFGQQPFTVSSQDRIAQAVLCPVERANLVRSTALSQTQRAGGKFGSTGVQ